MGKPTDIESMCAQLRACHSLDHAFPVSESLTITSLSGTSSWPSVSGEVVSGGVVCEEVVCGGVVCVWECEI